MADPLGLVGGGGAGGVRPVGPVSKASGGAGQGSGADFKEALLSNLRKVNEAQKEADRAVEDLVSGRRSDLEGVILATQKADSAFQMLQAVRGKVMQAYDEIKQIRV